MDNMAVIDPRNPNIIYQKLTEDRISESAELLADAFHRFEPMTSCLGIPYEGELLFNIKVCKRGAKHGVSVVAIDTNIDKVVGVSTGFLRNGFADPEEGDTVLIPAEFAHLFDPMYSAVDQLHIGAYRDYPDFLSDRYNPIMQIINIGTHPDYQGKGIAGRSAEIQMELAGNAKCRYVVVECTGLYTQKLYTKMGFETLSEIKYSDYQYNDETPFKYITSCPSLKLMIKQISRQY